MPPNPPPEIIEEVCLNAWPALQDVHYDGWLVRFADGLTKRTNSANAVRRGVLPIREKITHCEALYRAQSRPPIFRVLSYLSDGLDGALAERGYRQIDDTLTLYADLSATPPVAPGFAAELTPTPPSAEWLAARRRFQGMDDADGATLEKVLGALAIPAIFGAVRGPDGQIVSIAKGAVHHGIACLNLVATSPAVQRRGYSRACVSGVLQWAVREHGVRGACLQVLASNAPAIALYRQLGFDREAYRYHYWVRAA
jgi:ribosomal protein S18 acetylase RimI-like enzyme